LVGLLALGFFALTLKPVIESDGIGYFAYLHSVVVDHDFDLTDEYAALTTAHVVYSGPLVTARTETGLAADFFPIGPALLSLPAYLVAVAHNPSGEPQYGPPFTIAVALSSLFYGLLALALSYRLAREVTGSSSSATIGVLAGCLCTPFVYYLVYEPSYSHTFSAFAVAAFTYAWWRLSGGGSALHWVGLGVLGGVMAMVRFQDGLLLMLVLLDLKRARWRVLLAAAGALLAFTPQLWVDHVIFGTWLPQRPSGQELAPLQGHYLDVLEPSWAVCMDSGSSVGGPRYLVDSGPPPQDRVRYGFPPRNVRQRCRPRLVQRLLIRPTSLP
jgi:hypothetical protein